ncbi:TPA: hypothetical protein ACGO62_002189 [Streptococcus suis]
MAMRSAVLATGAVSDWLEESLVRLVATRPVAVSDVAVAVARARLLS